MTSVFEAGAFRRPELAQASRRQDWWRGAVIYQIYPRSFHDSDGDGVGDLPGVTAKLDHVAGLGVDAIWLCPFFTSPQKDFGYDVADHTGVDPIFGTQKDFDALVARAHALGLKVLIDQVWSHSSSEHPWFLESRQSRTNPKADWYVWADPSPDGTPPNNWLSVFGGSAWSWEPRRRQYYLHHFLNHQPQFNLRNPEVMDAILASGRFWLERGVDGFRLDAIDFLMHDASLRSNRPAPAPGGVTPTKLFALQHHDHDMLQPEAMEVLARIRGLMDEFSGTTTLAEVSSQPGAFERVMGYTSGDRHLHMAYTLRPLRGGFDVPTLRAMLADCAAAGTEGWPCWSFSNHDVERAISRWNPKRGEAPPDPRFARLLMSLLLSLRGSVCMYQGEELGLTESELALEDMRDPFGIAYWPEFRGRDGSRTPMPWQHDCAHGGFTTGPAPWLPVPADHHPLAVSAQEQDQAALLHAWRAFLRFRRTHPALIQGTLSPVTDLPDCCVGFVREHEEERILCLFNLSDAPVRLDLAAFGAVTPLGPEIDADHTTLGPWGSVFLMQHQAEMALAAD
jgi:alpha-glucosidase